MGHAFGGTLGGEVLARDKRLHLGAGVLICLFVGVVSTPVWGFVLAATAGAAKEIVWDQWLKRGTPEWLDFLATVIGGAIGTVWLTMFW